MTANNPWWNLQQCDVQYVRRMTLFRAVKEPYKRDYILQKRPTLLRSLLFRAVCNDNILVESVRLMTLTMGWLPLVGSLKL